MTPAALILLIAQIGNTFSVPKPLPALNPQIHGQFEPEPGIVADRVTYGSQFGMMVPAIVYHPKASGPRRPALIIVNGHGGDKSSWYSVYAGMLYARAGAVVLTYDPPGENERNSARKSGSRQHDLIQQPEEPMGRRMAGLMITDIEQAVSYLSQRPDVDSKRIATLGYSMGAFINDLACAVDTRLHSCVMVGGGNLDGPDGYWDASNKKMCQSYPYKALSFLGDRPAVLYAMQASHATSFIYNGREDDVVAMTKYNDAFFEDMQARAAKQHGGNKSIFEFAFSPTGGHRPWFVTRPVAFWLNQQLHFPNWSDDKVRALPETHTSEWAAKNHAFIDKSYATEAREGGTMALDSNIPGIPRENLNVFSDPEWTQKKDRLVLETWWAAARAAEQK